MLIHVTVALAVATVVAPASFCLGAMLCHGSRGNLQMALLFLVDAVRAFLFRNRITAGRKTVEVSAGDILKLRKAVDFASRVSDDG